MEFSVLNKKTVQCIMTEKEIADYGLDKKAIYKNDARVEDFFRQIMKRAQKETGNKKERGDVAVHATFLSDESLKIIFITENEASVLDPQQHLQAGLDVGMGMAVFKSRCLSHLIDFCAQAPVGLQSWLYKYRDVYFILADISAYTQRQTAVLFTLADEYVDAVCQTESIAAFLMEHGVCMIAEHAVEQLGKL